MDKNKCCQCGSKMDARIDRTGDRIDSVYIDGKLYVNPTLTVEVYQTKVCSTDRPGRPVFQFMGCEGFEVICNDAADALEGFEIEVELFIATYRAALDELDRLEGGR